MAEALDDGEFWLPSEFLTDDDILMETHKKFQKTESGARFCFPSEFPYGFSYGLNSPDESLVGSTETESDEDDYLTGFTRQMARSRLQQAQTDSSSVFSTENPKTRVMAGSPQSPLCGIGSWSGKSSSSSRGSPNNGSSQVSSPPSTPLNVKDDAWDLLYAAAGQVKKIQLHDEATKYSNIPLLSVPKKPSPVSNGGAGCYSTESLVQQQLQANHFYQLKQQQLQQQQQQLQQTVWGRQLKQATALQHQQQIPNNGGRSAGLVNGRSTRPLGLPPSAWPPLQQQQQQQQNGMRAVFLGGHATRRESAGTGVFLPRRNGNPSESRRKSTCSTVLLPARVVQALNLNFEDMAVGVNNGGAQHHPSSRYYGGSVHANALLSQHHHQKRSFRPQPIINSEAQLPQEWTY